jgi:hypothetical protein
VEEHVKTPQEMDEEFVAAMPFVALGSLVLLLGAAAYAAYGVIEDYLGKKRIAENKRKFIQDITAWFESDVNQPKSD